MDENKKPSLSMTSINDLPLDTMLDIFSRIPIESLARSKSVSTSWNHAISQPYLPLLHLQRSIQHPKPLNETTLINSHSNSKKSSSQLSGAHVRGCCNGLVYFAQDHRNVVTTLVVANPVTNETYELPPMNIPLVSPRPPLQESCGLGFDHSTNTFKMVAVLLIKQVPSANLVLVRQNLLTMVLDLGSSSWRQIPKVPSYPITGKAVFAHGFLYWFASHLHGQYSKDGRSIIRFDVTEEEFGLIKPPKRQKDVICVDELVDLNGEVGVAYNYVNNKSVVVWVLKQKKWVVHSQIDQKEACIPLREARIVGAWNRKGHLLVKTCEGFFVYGPKTGLVRDKCLGPEARIYMHTGGLFSIHQIVANSSDIQLRFQRQCVIK